MKRTYDTCFFCKGTVKEERVTVDYRWGGKFLVILNNVPAGVCQTCGEQYFKADVVRAMEKTAHGHLKGAETIEVPVQALKVA